MARLASPVSTKFVFFSSSLATLPLLFKRNSCIISRTRVVRVLLPIGFCHLSSQLMAMRHPRRLVLIGALGALWVYLKSPLPIRTPPLGMSRLVNRVLITKNPPLMQKPMPCTDSSSGSFHHPIPYPDLVTRAGLSGVPVVVPCRP